MTRTLDSERSPDSGAASGGDSVLELFQTAALLLGDQQEAITAVEKAVSKSEADPCADPAQALNESRALLVRLALERAVALDAAAFNGDNVAAEPNVCFDTDDLEGTGVRPEQLAQLVSGSGRSRLRDWLEQLRPEARVVFVLRAMLGKDSGEVATLLQASGASKNWDAAKAGQVFRSALCSLAGLLAHAPVAS